MEKFWEKLNQYDILNNLIPGAIFSLILKFRDVEIFARAATLEFVFLAYFCGIIISRIGSLVVEPILKRMHFLNFASYTDFQKAETIDSKVKDLSAINNMYRTFTALMLVYGISELYLLLVSRFTYLSSYSIPVLCTVLFILFAMSYRKQTAYISERVNHIISITDKEEPHEV